MRFAQLLISAVVFASLAAEHPVLAQGQQAAPSGGQQSDEEQQTPAPLAVGSMAIASDAALTIEAMSVDVAADSVTYAYKLRNKSPAKLSLGASVTQPDLELNSDGSTIYVLPTQTAENVVALGVKSGGKSVSTTPHVQAVALGVDRHEELTDVGIPLIPFGEATEKAIAGAKPETITKLESLGLVTPRDPSQPNAAPAGDWTLHVVHSWMQDLDPNVSTSVEVTFQPIKAVYTIDASGVSGFEALKDQTCLTPQFLNAVKALLVAKGSTVDVADMLIANDGPARWLQNPPATVAVHKPTSSSLVSFCGIDAKSQSSSTVTGVMPNSGEQSALRVLIFARSDGK